MSGQVEPWGGVEGQASWRTYEEAGQSNGEAEIGPAQNVALESHKLAVAQVAPVKRRKQVEQDAQRDDDSIYRRGKLGSAPSWPKSTASGARHVPSLNSSLRSAMGSMVRSFSCSDLLSTGRYVS